MKTKIILACAIPGAIAFLLAGCSDANELKEATAKYTEQTARAIIEGSWKIAGAIIGSAIIRAICNK